ncbi:unnamed protein product [Closterium sp. NIES-65]|nr:unnamed protein product [Closterium sp. NIES-65]
MHLTTATAGIGATVATITCDATFSEIQSLVAFTSEHSSILYRGITYRGFARSHCFVFGPRVTASEGKARAVGGAVAEGAAAGRAAEETVLEVRRVSFQPHGSDSWLLTDVSLSLPKNRSLSLPQLSPLLPPSSPLLLPASPPRFSSPLLLPASPPRFSSPLLLPAPPPASPPRFSSPPSPVLPGPCRPPLPSRPSRFSPPTPFSRLSPMPCAAGTLSVAPAAMVGVNGCTSLPCFSPASRFSCFSSPMPLPCLSHALPASINFSPSAIPTLPPDPATRPCHPPRQPDPARQPRAHLRPQWGRQDHSPAAPIRWAFPPCHASSAAPFRCPSLSVLSPSLLFPSPPTPLSFRHSTCLLPPSHSPSLPPAPQLPLSLINPKTIPLPSSPPTRPIPRISPSPYHRILPPSYFPHRRCAGRAELTFCWQSRVHILLAFTTTSSRIVCWQSSHSAGPLGCRQDYFLTDSVLAELTFGWPSRVEDIPLRQALAARVQAALIAAVHFNVMGRGHSSTPGVGCPRAGGAHCGEELWGRLRCSEVECGGLVSRRCTAEPRVEDIPLRKALAARVQAVLIAVRGRSEVGRSEVGRSEGGRSEVGRSEVGRSEVGRSEVGWSVVGWRWGGVRCGWLGGANGRGSGHQPACSQLVPPSASSSPTLTLLSTSLNRPLPLSPPLPNTQVGLMGVALDTNLRALSSSLPQRPPLPHSPPFPPPSTHINTGGANGSDPRHQPACAQWGQPAPTCPRYPTRQYTLLSSPFLPTPE